MVMDIFLPQEVVIELDVGVAVLLQAGLGLPVAGGVGAGLDAAEVVGDAGSEVVDVVVLHRHHPVRGALATVQRITAKTLLL